MGSCHHCHQQQSYAQPFHWRMGTGNSPVPIEKESEAHRGQTISQGHSQQLRFIQPSHPLSSPSSPALNLSQHQGGSQ